jgi:hypothetical protein
MRRFIASIVTLAAVITATVLVVGAQGDDESVSTIEAVSSVPSDTAEAVAKLPEPTTTSTSTTTTTTIDLGPPCQWNAAVLAFDPTCVAPPPPPPKPKPKPKPAPPPAPVIEQPAEPSPSPTGDRIWDHLASIRACESGGNYGIVSSSGKYRGAYQFSQTTWNSIARIAGRGDLVGVDPASASPGDQDAMAYALYVNSGPGQWPQCQHA